MRLRSYWETGRHLRAEQIYHRLRRQIVRCKPDLHPAPPERQCELLQWVAPARRRQSMLGPEEFSFLNETRRLAECGWDDAGVPDLWRYNLHYFDDLNAAGGEDRTTWHHALILRWIDENPPGQGIGWDAYPTSLRIVNWIKWGLAGNRLAPKAVESLAVQARWVSQQLEYHLLGNHLFANAKALIFAGCFFEGEEADGWLDYGMRILARELPEQILADGGHFELSTMYHALALEDLLDLVNVTRSARIPTSDRWRGQPNEWSSRINAMRQWLSSMCHPDGEIAFFNDAAVGIAPSPRELEDYASRLGFAPLAGSSSPFLTLQDSGYIRLNDGQAVVLLDVAKIGPDYLPGHAHADTLSFEMSLNGRRILVNSGTSVYGTGAERLRQRGTAAHNAVVVNGENSSEVWSGFRVARRARPKGLAVVRDDGWTVSCSHDGYSRLAGQPRHWRTWQFREGSLTVIDKIEGSHRHAVAAFHFHPDTVPSIASDGLSGTLAISSKTTLRWRIEKGSVKLEPSTWHPEFGLSVPSHRLMVTLADGGSIVEFSWADG